MKKYLLIIKSCDNIFYEIWDTYQQLMFKVSFIKNYDLKCIVKWYRIDNLNEYSLKTFKILRSLKDFILKNGGSYGK